MRGILSSDGRTRGGTEKRTNGLADGRTDVRASGWIHVMIFKSNGLDHIDHVDLDLMIFKSD